VVVEFELALEFSDALIALTCLSGQPIKYTVDLIHAIPTHADAEADFIDVSRDQQAILWKWNRGAIRLDFGEFTKPANCQQCDDRNHDNRGEHESEWHVFLPAWAAQRGREPTEHATLDIHTHELQRS
jgi:hypothetical protein